LDYSLEIWRRFFWKGGPFSKPKPGKEKEDFLQKFLFLGPRNLFGGKRGKPWGRKGLFSQLTPFKFIWPPRIIRRLPFQELGRNHFLTLFH